MQRALALRSRTSSSTLIQRAQLSLLSTRYFPSSTCLLYSTSAQDTRSGGKIEIPPSVIFNQSNRTRQSEKIDSVRKETMAIQSERQHEGQSGFPRPGRRRNGRHETRYGENGKKRKAEDSIDHPSSRRQHTDRHSDLESSFENDVAHIIANVKLPTRQTVRMLSKNFREQPKCFLHNAFQGSISFAAHFKKISMLHERCTVSCVLQDNTSVDAVGEGRVRKDAERAAYLHMCGKLYGRGLLGEASQKIDKLNNQMMQEEKDAKLDIYNYAARYGCIPQFSVHETSRLRTKQHGKRSGKVLEVIVEMPEHDITVVGRGVNLTNAEIAASIKFKQEAEKFHSKQGTSSLVIKDSSSLGIGNARDFFSYYIMVKPGSKFELQNRSNEGGNHQNRTRSQVMINGNTVADSVEMGTKKKAEDLACLVAAVKLVKEDPTLLSGFLKAPRGANGEILSSVSPIDMEVHEDCVILMQDTLLNARKAGLTNQHEGLESEEERDTSSYKSRPQLDRVGLERKTIELAQKYRDYLRRPDLQDLRKKREDLPMNQYRAKVLDIVNNNIYSIIIGATGSGKTTQVPQILLEEAIQKNEGASCNIVCTQPRRIAATSVARRVADERAEKLQESVGYQVRFDSKLPQTGGSVTYCTTGVLLQQLQHSPDDTLDYASHLIIDEVHERDMQIDFLLIILKKILAQRIERNKSIPKVVLMSATMDSVLFASYFKNTHPTLGVTDCPTLSVPGRTFPVKEQHLEAILSSLNQKYDSTALGTMYNDLATRDYFESEKTFAKGNSSTAGKTATPLEEDEDESIIDWKKERRVTADGQVVVSTEKEDSLVPLGLVATTIAHITKTTAEGAVLVFLPGLDEIVKVDAMLRNDNVLGVDFKDESKFKTYMLHSSIANGQTEVFSPVPPGCRKIILGTNIAETSITIPEVQYVVDTGKLREKQYDQLRRINKLACTWVSKSNSKQRAGRAGRVQNGHYYALFSKPRYESLRAIGKPELLRADLQETCLDVKAQAFKTPIREFLAEAIEPPDPAVVDSAVLNLQALDALTEDEKLTSLGRLLAQLPVHPTLGKMIVLGVVFRCLDPMLILAAAPSERPLFANPLGERERANAAKAYFVKNSASDHIGMLNAFREMRAVRSGRGRQSLWEFAQRSFVHQGAFQGIEGTANQIEEVLVAAGLIPYTAPQSREKGQFGDPSLNQNSGNMHLIKALVLAGLHPNLAVNTGGPMYRTPGERNAMVHPSSINTSQRGRQPEHVRRNALMTYTTMAHDSSGKSISLRETTESSPLMACLFGGHLSCAPTNAHILEMDSWLPFYVKSEDRRATKTILEFRKALERVLTGAFKDLSRKKGKDFLAEDKVRQVFAEGLVEVLNNDVRFAGNAYNRRGFNGYHGRGDPVATGESSRPMGKYWRREDSARGRYGAGEGPTKPQEQDRSARDILARLKTARYSR